MKFKYMWREAIHKALVGGFKLMRNFDLQIENRKDYNGPVLYASVHTNSNDVPVVMDAINKHAYLLASDEVKHKIGGLGFEMNGVIFVHREDKESRKESVPEVVNTLKDGKSVLIFPEGTWNTTPSKPILNLQTGVISMALQANVPIVPIVTEYYDTKCVVRFGEPLKFENIKFDNREDCKKYKLQCLDKLEESLSTMKWEVWEQNSGVYNRLDGDLNDKRLKYMKKVYPAIDYEYEKQFHFNKVQYLEDVCPINTVEVNKKRR